MSRRTAEELIAELAASAAPVRRIPRLRSAAGLVLLASTAVGTLALTAGGGAAAVAASAPWADPRFCVVLIGLVLLAGAVPAALASAVPGREGAACLAGAAAAVGALLAVGGGVASALHASSQLPAGVASSAVCAAKGAALALLPLAIAAAFLARGVPRRPRLAAGLGGVGAAALGGAVVHLGCRAAGALHVLLGHAVAPLLLGAALALPVAWWVARRRSRARPGLDRAASIFPR